MKLTTVLILISVLATCCLTARADDVKPLYMMQKTMLCGDIAGTPTKGFESGKGLYTIALLIKTWGDITYRDPNGKFFYIDDGSSLWDGTKDSANKNVLGVRVNIDNLATGNSIAMPGSNVAMVSVVGILTTFEDSNSKIRPDIRPRNQPDVVTLRTL